MEEGLKAIPEPSRGTDPDRLLPQQLFLNFTEITYLGGNAL